MIKNFRVTYYEDLSGYAYCDVDIIGVDGGWLDAPHLFTEGRTPDWFTDALLNVLRGPTVNAMRGP